MIDYHSKIRESHEHWPAIKNQHDVISQLTYTGSSINNMMIKNSKISATEQLNGLISWLVVELHSILFFIRTMETNTSAKYYG